MKPNTNAVGIGKVIVAELADIAKRRGEDYSALAEPSDAEWKAACHKQQLFGICLSGGGIRSATFALGILQGLAELKLLPKADYLSTVSGGGYIGSWLQGVFRRTAPGQDPFRALTRDVPGPPTKDPISFLRKYSDYLSPRAGLSLDAVVIPVIWLRNTLLNQAIIVTAFLSAFLLLLVPGAGVRYAATSGTACLAWLWLILCLALSVVAVFTIGYNLRKIEERELTQDGSAAFRAGEGTERVTTLVVLPLFLAVLFLVHALVSPTRQLISLTGQRAGFLVLWGLFGLLQWRGGFERWCKKQGQTNQFWRWFHLVWMSGVSAGFVLLLFRAIYKLISLWAPESDLGSVNTIAWGLPLCLIALMAGVTLLIGLMGADFPDASREWLARAGALLWVVAFGWAVAFAIALFSPYWVVQLWIWKKAAIISAATAWIGTTASSVLAGKSRKAGGADKSKPDMSTTLDLLARYGPMVAVTGFLITLAFGLQVLLRARLLGSSDSFLAGFVKRYWEALPYSPSSWYLPLIVFVATTTIFIVLSLRVNINEFSLHHFYKNRLVRCFLGASAAHDRVPDSFTGFDPQDDIPLDKLKCEQPKETAAPYPILNCTLTLTTGSELATQERKAVSWIFTPLHSGFYVERSAANEDTADKLSPYGFVKTKELLCDGVRLGTAMAISGAALNPSDGFHFAAQTAFLMTLFDVRLGWWAGNPRNATTYKRTGPRFALWCLLRELFGFVDDRSAYLNLSDGGNFENLGLYELVRRRCRYVIVVDAEQDPKYVFESLGGAVRKCREDFGVEIEINPRPIMAKEGLSSSHCVIGRIYYPPEEHAEPGWILYLKTSITGDEPADVEEYRRQHEDFPQQSTAQQFFLESQFESYRRLGLHVARTTFDGLDFDSGLSQAEKRFGNHWGKELSNTQKACLTLACIFERLENRWTVPPNATEGAFERQAAEYMRLMERLAGIPELKILDPEVLEKVSSDQQAPQRAAAFFRIDLFQFMENVFFDLGFAGSHAWNHPANAGWKRVFEYWAAQEAMQALWGTQRANYSKPFQNFFDDLINKVPPPPPERRV